MGIPFFPPLPLSASRRLILYQLVDKKSTSARAEEWMYVLQEEVDQLPCPYELAFSLSLQGEAEKVGVGV